MKLARKQIVLWIAATGLCVGCAAPRTATTGRATDEPVPETVRSDASITDALALKPGDSLTDSSLCIGIDRDGKISVNNREVQSNRLVDTLEKSSVPKDAPIRIEAHPQAPFEHVVHVLAPLRNAGYTRIAIDTAE